MLDQQPTGADGRPGDQAGGEAGDQAGDQAGGDPECDALALAAFELAKRFSAGATMWCVAPAIGEHGSHVAVEFVHPVIVGKRALPAVHLPGPDFTASLRLLSKPGDVLLLIGTGSDPALQDLLSRCDPWGLTSVWVGAGLRPGEQRPGEQRPGGHRADHVVWVDRDDMGLAARNGELVMRYHLLWELTHVVFEHPGLLIAAPSCGVGDAGGDGDGRGICVTCSDEGRVVEVVSVSVSAAKVLAAGRHETVDVSLIDGAKAGDLLLVHAGVALSRLTEASP